MYWQVIALIETLIAVANQFEKRTRVSSVRQQREIAQFLQSIYFDEKNPRDLGSAFPLLNTERSGPSTLSRLFGLRRFFEQKQLSQVAPALSAINIENLIQDFRMPTHTAEILRELHWRGDLGSLIPDYLERYAQLPPGNHDYESFKHIYQRIKDLNGMISPLRSRPQL
jgi:hypothetical protein